MRLIDLDELMKFPIRLNHYDKVNGNEHYVFGVEAVLEYAEHLPTIDAEVVLHGRWKYFHKQNRAVCLVCSFERDLDADFGKAVSCPNCGARMDAEVEG